MPAASTIPLTDLPAFGAQLARDVVGGDYSPALRRIVVAGKSDFAERFDTATAPDGSPWPPIRGFRVRQGRGSPRPLQDRGLLRASAAAQGQGHIELLTAFSMELGTNLDYADTHNQDGKVGARRTIRPKRGKALAIPLTIEAYRHGSPRTPSPFPRALRLVWPKGKRYGFLVEDKAGRGKKATGAKSILHYLLVPEVTIPARPFAGWSPKLLAITDTILAEHMKRLAAG